MEDVAEQKEWNDKMNRRAEEIQAGLEEGEEQVDADAGMSSLLFLFLTITAADGLTV